MPEERTSRGKLVPDWLYRRATERAEVLRRRVLYGQTSAEESEEALTASLVEFYEIGAERQRMEDGR